MEPAPDGVSHSRRAGRCQGPRCPVPRPGALWGGRCGGDGTRKSGERKMGPGGAVGGGGQGGHLLQPCSDTGKPALTLLRVPEWKLLEWQKLGPQPLCTCQGVMTWPPHPGILRFIHIWKFPQCRVSMASHGSWTHLPPPNTPTEMLGHGSPRLPVRSLSPHYLLRTPSVRSHIYRRAGAGKMHMFIRDA